MDTKDPLSLWQHIHGATTHFPIALAFISAIFDAGALVFRRPNWRTVGFWTLITALVLILPAIASGLYGIYLDSGGKEKWASDGYNHVRAIIWHRNMSFFAGGLLFVAATWRVIKHDDLTMVARIVCLLLAIAATVFVGVTGYNGAYLPLGY